MEMFPWQPPCKLEQPEVIKSPTPPHPSSSLSPRFLAPPLQEQNVCWQFWPLMAFNLCCSKVFVYQDHMLQAVRLWAIDFLR